MKKILRVVLFAAILPVVLTTSSFSGEKDLYWKKFNPGTWVLYELTDGLQKKISLITKTDAEITLRTEIIKEANIIGTSEERIPLDLSTESAVAPKPGMREYVQDTMVVNQVIPCKIYEYNTKEGLQSSWFSDQIPGGLVKSAIEDTITVKLIDYEAKYYVK